MRTSLLALAPVTVAVLVAAPDRASALSTDPALIISCVQSQLSTVLYAMPPDPGCMALNP